MHHASTILMLACVFGLFMAWGIGANDVANAMGTSVGSKALSLKQALLIAAVFEFAGAFLAGGQVTATIRKGIINSQPLMHHPEIFLLGMLAAMLAASLWLGLASYRGWPVSTTHSIVGAIVGFASVAVGVNAIQWHGVIIIALSWIISPILSGVIAFCLFVSIQRLILNAPDPYRNAQRYAPIYLFITGFVLSLVTLTKGLKHVGLPITPLTGVAVAFGIGVLAVLLGSVLIRRMTRHLDTGTDVPLDRHQQFKNVEKVFAVMMIFTACSMAFAHGSNDVANAIGPLAAIVGVVKAGGMIGSQAVIPSWVLLLGGSGIVLGLATYGYKVMATIGGNITELTPSRGFVAELATASTVVLASGTGLPISTTQTLVGAVLGVGIARGIGALNLRVINGVFLSWVVTLPVSALLAVIIFEVLKVFLG